jgi:hypothetical protein
LGIGIDVSLFFVQQALLRCSSLHTFSVQLHSMMMLTTHVDTPVPAGAFYGHMRLSHCHN